MAATIPHLHTVGRCHPTVLGSCIKPHLHLYAHYGALHCSRAVANSLACLLRLRTVQRQVGRKQ